MANVSLQVASIATSLIACGGIAGLSIFDVPQYLSQPAERSLGQVRWMFSRGSHIFPTSAFVATAGFVSLAVSALPAGRTALNMLRLSGNSFQVNGYLIAGALNLAIAPWTAVVMIPTNFRLIQLQVDKGGARSEDSAKHGSVQFSQTTAEDSVDSKGDISQWKDLSGAQEKTPRTFTQAEEEEVKGLLQNFGRLNAVRAILCGLGGVVGLVAALS